MMRLSQNIIRNGVKNALQQEQSFIPLPPIDELVLSGNEKICTKEKKVFSQMCANGKALEKEIYAAGRKMIMDSLTAQRP